MSTDDNRLIIDNYKGNVKVKCIHGSDEIDVDDYLLMYKKEYVE